MVRKVLKKKIPSKDLLAKSSSTDDGQPPKRRGRPPLKSKKNNFTAAGVSSKEKECEINETDKTLQNVQRTSIDDSHFSKPQNPPIVKASSSLKGNYI